MKAIRNFVLLGLLVLPGCAVVERVEEVVATAMTPEPEPGSGEVVVSRPTGKFTPVKDKELVAYKQQVAQRIAASSSKTFSGELPPMLKSVVILDLTVDKNGRTTRVAVSRSNGFKELERAAIDSVQRTTLPAPSASLLNGGQVRYLETWLFRDDGKFQIRSLVREPQPGAEKMG